MNKFYLISYWTIIFTFLQNITTKQPDDKMIEVSITALKDAFGNEYDRFIGKKFKAEAIGWEIN